MGKTNNKLKTCKACMGKMTPIIKKRSVMMHQDIDVRRSGSFGLYVNEKKCPLCGETI